MAPNAMTSTISVKFVYATSDITFIPAPTHESVHLFCVEGNRITEFVTVTLALAKVVEAKYDVIGTGVVT